jgi:hypothetical protein
MTEKMTYRIACPAMVGPWRLGNPARLTVPMWFALWRDQSTRKLLYPVFAAEIVGRFPSAVSLRVEAGRWHVCRCDHCPRRSVESSVVVSDWLRENVSGACWIRVTAARPTWDEKRGGRVK